MTGDEGLDGARYRTGVKTLGCVAAKRKALMNLRFLLKQAMPKPVKSALEHVIQGRRNSGPKYQVPQHLGKNYRTTDPTGLAELRESIMNNYHVGWRSKRSYSADGYERDLNDHLLKRLQNSRSTVIPWLDTLRPLRERKILEIGCGTGSSTLALAEQGAVVVGIDVDEGALRVARDRCRVYGVAVDVRALNATRLDEEFQHGDFDLIIFYASLEHMTLSERLAALSQAWSILPVGGMLSVIETPNRLWFFDGHTALLPFFHWLPDELAFQYSRFSSRENFREIYREQVDVSFQHFLRRGRGASFHEFDLAIQPVNTLTFARPLSAFLEENGLYRPSSAHAAFQNFLQQQSPAVPAVFFEPDLNLVIQKTASGGRPSGAAGPV